ncbi:MAG TPA: DUF484 family protein, partial [Burkholderiaceae bacterium]
AEDVARFLEQHPDFFEHNARLLTLIHLPDPHDGRAVSLIERQSVLLRERLRALETRVAELIRHGEDNDGIADRLVRWACALLAARDRARIAEAAIDELKRLFTVPYGALRVWTAEPELAGLPCAGAVSSDVIRLASSMRAPYCGANVDFEAAGWMSVDSADIASLAMIPLRSGTDPDAFGLIVLGSPDASRFDAAMGTAFLARIGDLASAALAPAPH